MELGGFVIPDWLLIVAAIALVLYFLFKRRVDGTDSNRAIFKRVLR